MGLQEYWKQVKIMNFKFKTMSWHKTCLLLKTLISLNGNMVIGAATIDLIVCFSKLVNLYCNVNIKVAKIIFKIIQDKFYYWIIPSHVINMFIVSKVIWILFVWAPITKFVLFFMPITKFVLLLYMFAPINIILKILFMNISNFQNL